MILNIYKPKGWTSFNVVAKVRNILRDQFRKKNIKVGHAGTLDPLAEGVLVVLTDYDTKKQDLLMKKPKEYLAEIAFGATSPTYDLEMPLSISKKLPSLKELKTKLPALINNYIGEIEQTVPAFSAVKVDGKRLYKKARAEEIVLDELPTKRITIESFEVIEISEKLVQEVLLTVLECRVYCSSGTYLRSIANDLGNDLGCGGVLISLVRTRVGDHLVEDSISVEDLEETLKKHSRIL